MLFERMQFVQLLYDMLPDNKARILTGKAIQSLEQDNSGVTVTCSDGSTFTADLLVGADGVHSRARQLIFPGLSNSGDKKDSKNQHIPGPFQSTYKCIFGLSTTPPLLPANQMIEIHNRGISWQLLSMAERTAWFLFIRKDEPSHTSHRYTEADAEEIAGMYASYPVWKDGAVTFGDLWRARLRAKLVDLEEGILETWYAGRVVLLGDAAHKMTPNLAMGCNNAMESAVVLTNVLHALDESSQAAGSKPIETGELEEVFAEYQRQRYQRASSCVSTSRMYTRFAAWNNWLYEIFGTYVAPLLGARLMVDYGFAPMPRGGRVLDFVRENNRKEGKVKWYHEGKRIKNGD
jgi:2-polyprenyl-6-methoxyphenol hydroxylase-like FAD-dependent oxidoreductase